MDADVVDLRSDVVTEPTGGMRAAMSAAQVGAYTAGNDDEDPTVKQLECELASRFGMDGALFLPSVTMANLIACMHYCGPGEQAIVDCDAHLYRHELGGLSRLAGVVPRVARRDGALPAVREVKRILDERHIETPIRLIWVEDTHTDAGGAVADPALLGRLGELGRRESLRVHMDGARVFNAAVSLGISLAETVEKVDSVSVSFVKGLACPVGSALIGSRELIEHGRELRRMLGGMWLKAGVLAAPCLLALNTMVSRLVEDHETAAQLARIVDTFPSLSLQFPVQTNQVRIRSNTISSAEFRDMMWTIGRIKIGVVAPRVVRMVTHLGVGVAEIERTRATLTEVLGSSTRYAVQS